MTPEQQQLVLLEALGWKLCTEVTGNPLWYIWSWIDPNGRLSARPDHLQDLNACHQAEAQLLTDEDMQMEFQAHLARIILKEPPTAYHHWSCTGSVFIAHAEAPQRVEALVRTIGKWKDA